MSRSTEIKTPAEKPQSGKPLSGKPLTGKIIDDSVNSLVKKLTQKQQEAFDYMAEGKNVFLTGPSGTGKSMVIHTFKKIFGPHKNIAITSTTGISALLIGGTTLHSYLGIGLGQGSAEKLADDILKKSYMKLRWNKLDVLIIDEVSMLSPELFDKLEQVARIVRSKQPRRLLTENTVPEIPFGGIQLILSGDFLQLPVVGSDNFCFEAKTWPQCIDHTVNLTEIIRQDDEEFQTILNQLRFGIVSKEGKKLLKSRIGKELKNDLGIKPTKIYTTNAQVDLINERELEKLASDDVTFYEYAMEIYFYEFVQNKIQALDRVKKNCMAPETLQLCKGAQVMLLTNLDLDSGLANGSRGVVKDFCNDLPVVLFLNGEERIIDYYVWEIEEGNKKAVKITQLPLKLAWAVTVHKSQGSTLDYAEVDLSSVFEYGQAYVALSRVKTKEGLSILNIDFDRIRCHPKACDFYREMETQG